jgi:hypothetical protein
MHERPPSMVPPWSTDAPARPSRSPMTHRWDRVGGRVAFKELLRRRTPVAQGDEGRHKEATWLGDTCHTETYGVSLGQRIEAVAHGGGKK